MARVAIRLVVLTAQPPPSVLIKDRRALLGRSEHCDVRIPDPTVSREHAIIVKRGPNYLLIDQGSAQGTHVALPDCPRVTLAPDSPRVLEDGEHIWLGQIELRVELTLAKRGEESGLQELAPALVRAGLTAVGIEATDDRVRTTLEELTALEDESRPDWEPPEVPSEPEIGVAALAEDDKNPPWLADAFVAAIALLFASGCVWGLMRLKAAFE